MGSLQVILCVCVTVLVQHAQAQDLKLEIAQGEVTGKRTAYNEGLEGAVTSEVDSFLGVPYAQQPVGDLRFKDPEKLKSGTSVPHDGSSYGPRCMQSVSILYDLSPEARVPGETQREDCLRLNIWSPHKAVSQFYPVMVYIFGGSYVEGSGNWFDGHVLAQYGVVVVTINYRLNLMGFLTDGHADSQLPGDQGIKDQIQALRWIKENIKDFDGDPSKVTIFGNSAGGWSVSLLLALKEAEGLFHRAIVMSGPLLAKMSHQHDPAKNREDLVTLAKSLECPTDLSKMDDVLKCLRGVDADKMNTEIHKITQYMENQLLLYKGSRLLPKEPLDMFKDSDGTGHLNRVPVMIGNVKHEAGRHTCFLALDGAIRIESDGTFDSSAVTADEKRTKLRQALGVIEAISYIHLTYDQTTAAIDEYFPDAVLADSKRITTRLIELISDLVMVAPGVQMAKILQSRGVQPYFYIFDHSLSLDVDHPGLNLQATCGWLPKYTYHETELPFVFGNAAVGSWSKSVWHSNKYTDAEKQLSQNVMKLWTDFAKAGAPPTEMNWQPFGADTYDYLKIKASGFENKQNLRRKKMNFWIDKIFSDPNNV